MAVTQLTSEGGGGDQQMARLVALLDGSQQAMPKEDIFELVAGARAEIQSGLLAGNCEHASRVVDALHTGLNKRELSSFTKEQAPEFVAELLLTCTTIPDKAHHCEEALQLILAKCKTQEVYTFALEALCDHDLSHATKVRCTRFLSNVFDRLDMARLHLFMSSCLPLALRMLTKPDFPESLLCDKLGALRQLATANTPPRRNEDGSELCTEDKVVRSVASACLFKALSRSYHALGACKLEIQDVPTAHAKGTSGGVQRSRVLQRVTMTDACVAPDVLASLVAIAKDAGATSPTFVASLCEELDVADPCSDGGGDSEVSPLAVASWVCLSELLGQHDAMFPQALPSCISAIRAVNILMRSTYVLLANKSNEQMEALTFSGHGLSSTGNAVQNVISTCWPNYGLALFTERAVPMLQVVAVQTPRALESLNGPLLRWNPSLLFLTVLESLATLPDLEQQVRAAIYRIAAVAMRSFPWSCRCDMYMDIMQRSHTDSVIGAVAALWKDDWWQHVCELTSKGQSLHEDRARLVRLFQATLSGDVQIIDGMDTLTAALNIARLVVLAKDPIGSFMRQALRSGQLPSVDLEALLAKVSSQIDFELRLLEAPSDQAPSSAMARLLAEELGKAEGAPDLKRMKSDRIAMVAHLVARVRELLAQ